MTTPTLPQSGGSWIREADGTLRRADARPPAPARSKADGAKSDSPKPDSPNPDKEAGK